MAEDKADKALRQVIINLIPQRFYGGPVDGKDILSVDISDKLQDGEFYCLYNIKSVNGDLSYAVDYVPFNDHKQFKGAVENILDAVIVNAKQRQSVQQLLDEAFYSNKKFDCAL